MTRAPIFHCLRVAAALLVVGLGSFACAPVNESEGDPAGLVPADAAALEAYLKSAIVSPVAPPTPRWIRVDSTAELSGARDADFSTTTLQTAGVDEADLVKFDGETLFVARQPVYPQRLEFASEPLAEEPAQAAMAMRSMLPETESDPAVIAVYSAIDDPAQVDEIAMIPLPGAASIHGMILLPEGDDGPPLLVVIGGSREDSRRTWVEIGVLPTRWFHENVRLWIFDVSEPGEPIALHRSRVEGSLLAVRRIRGQLVLVTRYSPQVTFGPTWLPVRPSILSEGADDEFAEQLAELDLQDLLPRRWIQLPEGDAAARPLVQPEDCFVPKKRADTNASLFYYYHPTVVTISTIDLRAPDEMASVCAAGPVERIFSSTRALYLAATSWGAESETVIHKFAYTERGPEFRGSGQVPGVPGGSNPDFGLGETGDAFGIMTTVTSSENFERTARLTLLAEADDGSLRLEEISHLPNEREPSPIGKPGEQLYAVRFLGNRVYAVTFRRIDPLYVIDVEDPYAPFIAGELEIPGFSDALHPITANLLIGVGKDSIEDAGVDWFQGVKVELFDVSDPSEPVSVDALVIGRRGSDTAARSDHHAFTSLDLGDGTSRIALPLSVAAPLPGDEVSQDPRTYYPWSHTGLHLFEVDHDAPALRDAGVLVVAEAGDEGATGSTWQDRSRLQGDAVHYVHEGEVWSAPWTDTDAAAGPR